VSPPGGPPKLKHALQAGAIAAGFGAAAVGVAVIAPDDDPPEPAPVPPPQPRATAKPAAPALRFARLKVSSGASAHRPGASAIEARNAATREGKAPVPAPPRDRMRERKVAVPPLPPATATPPPESRPPAASDPAPVARAALSPPALPAPSPDAAPAPPLAAISETAAATLPLADPAGPTAAPAASVAAEAEPAPVSPPPRTGSLALAAAPPSRALPKPAFAMPAPPAAKPSAVPAHSAQEPPESTTGAAFSASAALPAARVNAPSAAPSPLDAELSRGAPRSDDAAGAPVFTPDDELILAIATQNGEVGDTVIAYGTRAGVYLPLGEIARLLDLAVVVSDDGHYASGWILDESRTIELNLREGRLRVNGREVPFARRDAASLDGELYLRSDRFSDLMPLSLGVDLRSQAVTIATQVPFPFEQRAEREAAREKLSGRGRGPAPKFARENTPYKAIDMPLGDVEVRAVSDTSLGSRGETDVRLAGDVAFMTGRAFASVTTRDGLVAARLELGRRDPDAGLLGPLNATEFQVGDVSTTALPVGLRGIGGRGLMITNAPLSRASVFDRIDLRGDLPDGYEAELYRNNTLVGSTRLAVNGRYEFLQVPVEFGLNVFRLVLYGPQGQRREEVRRISVGDGRLAQGEFRYALGLAQKDVSLIDVHGPNFSPGDDYRAWRGTALAEYGISTGLTASLGGAWFESRGSRHWLAATGLRTSIAGIAARADFSVRDGGAKAYGLGLGGRTAGVNWTASHFEYQGGFADELRGFTGEPLVRATEFDLNTVLPVGRGGLPLAARGRRVAFADGRVEADASLRASALVGPALVSNSLSLRRTTAPGNAGVTQLTGTFDLATLAGSKTQYRASLDYAVAPRAEITAVRLDVDRSVGTDTTLRLSAGHVLTGDTTTLGLSAIHRFRRFSLAFDGDVTMPGRSYTAVLRLSFSFGRSPLGGGMFLDRPGLSAGGAAAVRVFADDDGDGRMGPGEAPLEGVDVVAGSSSVTTDAHGIAFVGALGDGQGTSLRIDSSTLPEVSSAPSRDGIEIVPRPGRVHAAEFAIVGLSDIEGTTWLGTDGREISGIVLELVDAAGKVAGRTRSGSGGAFWFEQVRPGRYDLRLAAAQARNLGIELLEPVQVDIGARASTARVAVRVRKRPAQ